MRGSRIDGEGTVGVRDGCDGRGDEVCLEELSVPVGGIKGKDEKVVMSRECLE